MMFDESCCYFTRVYTTEEIEKLNKMHTKQLMNERNKLYTVTGYCNDLCCHDAECHLCQANIQHNKEQLKKILATREHVLNKKEAKELRKARAKGGSSIFKGRRKG